MEVLKCLKFPPLISELWGCAEESEHAQLNFRATVTEGVVHGVYTVVTRSSFGVIQRHQTSGGKWTFCHYDTR